MATDGEVDTDRFYLETEQVSVDSEDEFIYDDVSVDEELHLPQDVGEDLDEAVRTIKDATEDETVALKVESLQKANITAKPEIVDDFVRNFLVHMDMRRTLDCFQTEWYELQQKGLLNVDCVGVVPDFYSKHQLIEEELRLVKQELVKYKHATMKAKDVYTKLRKERDFHQMHHKRVMQEKDRLINEIKRLKEHYSMVEPAIQQLKLKYETAMKEKMLSQLERDRAVGQADGLQHTLKSMESFKSSHSLNNGVKRKTNRLCNVGGVEVDQSGRGPTQKMLLGERASAVDDIKLSADLKRHPDDSIFPPDRGINPLLSGSKKIMSKITKAGGFHLSTSFIAHSYPISSVAIHPRKDIIATGSDDNKWKLWSIPLGEVILSGEGHTDWVSNCSFHPDGTSLMTSSGDGTVKIWNFSHAECMHTFSEHMGPVWGCDWHWSGDFVISCAVDNTCRLWDLNSLRCRNILRGHTNCVNSTEFLPFSNTILTASADKTVSLWDARTAICAQTFYGHTNSVNHATFNPKGDMVVSCDSYGKIKLWDVRTVAPMVSFDVGPHPANHVTFDPSGSVVAIASNDSTIKMYQLANGQMQTMVGHEDNVQCVRIDHAGEYILSVGNDCHVRIWC